jgi:hypothetical protein
VINMAQQRAAALGWHLLIHVRHRIIIIMILQNLVAKRNR